MPHISIAAEKIGYIGKFPITNSLVTTWLVMCILVLFSILSTRKQSMIPSNLQQIAEVVVDGLYGLFNSVNGKYTKQVFPLLASIFLYIIIANWVGLLPGVGTLGFFKTEKSENTAVTAVSEQVNRETPAGSVESEGVSLPTPSARVTSLQHAPAPQEDASQKSSAKAEFIPLFRGATADINTTLALAIIAVVAIQYYGFVNFGGVYSTRFLNFSNPINFFLGILEIISELSKIISFAFRLFGNIFAGEVLLTVIAFLMPFIAPLPFLTLELFVGFIQALVFAMLTSVFLNVAIVHGEHEAHLREHASHASQ